MSEPTPEAVEALARVLGQHWHAGMHRGGAPSQWECECDEKLAMSDEAHREHAARAVLATGYVSPDEHHETLNDYGKAVGDLNLANYRLAQVEAALGESFDALHARAPHMRFRVVDVTAVRAALESGS